MKTSKLLVAVAAMAFAGFAAADTSDVGVTAKVLGTCKFDTSTAADFGSLDPMSPAAQTATGAVTFWCTNGTTYNLSANNGANASGTQKRMKGPGASDFINYSLSLASTTGTGLGKSTSITVNADASLTATAYQDSVAGNYSDAVTVTIAP
jgi:spore coat protein U-like protein